jgi:PKD repeat protein
VTAVNGAPTPTVYTWDCDNSVSSIDFTTSTPSTSCTYLTAGNITGKVTVTGGSVTGTATTTVTVTPVLVPSYTVSLAASPTTVVAGGVTVTLTATPTLVNTTVQPTLFTWDCGVGSAIAAFGNPNVCGPYPTAASVTAKVSV